MSFGGTVSAMLINLRNNKKSRTSTFEKIERYRSKYRRSNKLFFAKKATLEEINKIGEETRRENRNILVQKIALISTVSLLVLFAIGFVKF